MIRGRATHIQSRSTVPGGYRSGPDSTFARFTSWTMQQADRRPPAPTRAESNGGLPSRPKTLPSPTRRGRERTWKRIPDLRPGETSSRHRWWRPIPSHILHQMSDRQIRLQMSNLERQMARLRLEDRGCKRRLVFDHDCSSRRLRSPSDRSKDAARTRSRQPNRARPSRGAGRDNVRRQQPQKIFKGPPGAEKIRP